VDEGFRWQKWLLLAGAVLVVIALIAIAIGNSDDEPSVFGELRELSLLSVAAAHGIESYQDLSFLDLKSHSLVVTYSELDKNFAEYSTWPWIEAGEPADSVPPMLYFYGRMAQAEEYDGGGIGEDAKKRVSGGLWSGLLELEDGNAILLAAADPRSSVGDRVEVVVVCKDSAPVIPRECIPFKIETIER
jgi:hypothetical protein